MLTIGLKPSLVDFVVQLHKVHEIPLALAYSSGVSQFRSLRATHEIALASAQAELAAHGFIWPTEFSAIDRTARAEERNLMGVVKDQQHGTLGASLTNNLVDASPMEAEASNSNSSSSSSSLLQPLRTQQAGWSEGIEYLKGSRAPVKVNAGRDSQIAQSASGDAYGQLQLAEGTSAE